MGKTKPSASKKPKRTLDFKKIKRKIGRKLPPPKNFTNTTISSKAIILPEQSIATEKAGLAVNKKGLTLRDLLQQTSHHNPKTRRVALSGIRDLISKHPSELKLHKLTMIEKLRERICDNDKAVRESLYQILKTVVFPSFKEDVTWDIISLLMAYVFNAMAHITVDIRLMAFRFFELIVLNYPSSFMTYTELVLDNYTDILRNYQIYLHEKSNLKNALGGLVHCLTLLVGKGREDDPNKPNIYEKRRLYSYSSEVHYDDAVISSALKKFQDLVPALISCFQESSSSIHSMSSIDKHSFDCLLCTIRCINLCVTLFVERMNKLHAIPDGCSYDMVVLLKKVWETFPISQGIHSSAKDDERCFLLDVKITETFLHLFPWINGSLFPVANFLEFIESSLLGVVDKKLTSNKSFIEKHLCQMLPFIPRLILQVTADWKPLLLNAFTVAFKDCKVDSQICMHYLDVIKEMVLPATSCAALSGNHREILGFQVDWLHELPRILCCIGNRHLNISNTILKLILSIGQSSTLVLEYDCLQSLLTGFYSFRSSDDAICYGPFIKLPFECQEVAIYGLYYFSNLSVDLLESLAFCCLNPALNVFTVVRIVEVLYSAYRAAHVNISNMMGFLFTLIAHYKVNPTWFEAKLKDNDFSNRGAFKLLVGHASSCLSQMGDNSLVLKLMYKFFFSEASRKPSLDNMHAMLKMIITLDTKPSTFLDKNAVSISKWLASYITNAASYIPEDIEFDIRSNKFRIFKYYIRPCIMQFYRNGKLLLHIFELLSSSLMEGITSDQSPSGFNFPLELLAQIHAISFILSLMHDEGRCHESLSQSKDAIKEIVQYIGHSLEATSVSVTHEEKHKLQLIYDRLNTIYMQILQ